VEKWRVKTERILTLAIMLDVAHKFCSCGTRTVPTLLAACLSWPLGYYACHTLTLLIIIYSPLSFVFLTIKHISPNCCHVSDMSHTLTLLGHTSNYIYSAYIPLRHDLEMYQENERLHMCDLLWGERATWTHNPYSLKCEIIYLLLSFLGWLL
jgi:hypothetical protein